MGGLPAPSNLQAEVARPEVTPQPWPGNTAMAPEWTYPPATVRLRWNDNSTNETGFQILRYEEGSNLPADDPDRWRVVVNTNANQTEYVDEVGEDAVYHYAVRAFLGNPADSSSWTRSPVARIRVEVLDQRPPMIFYKSAPEFTDVTPINLQVWTLDGGFMEEATYSNESSGVREHHPLLLSNRRGGHIWLSTNAHLIPGRNVFTISVADRAGNHSDVSYEVTYEPNMMNAPFGLALVPSSDASDTGTVYEWGNLHGTSWTRNLIPVLTGDGTPLTDVRRVAWGIGHGMALKADGSLWTWGLNHIGQLGEGTATEPRAYAVQVMTGITDVWAVGHTSLVSKQDGTYWAWGATPAGSVNLSPTLVTEQEWSRARSRGLNPNPSGYLGIRFDRPSGL
ncbi:MAG: hypothetical protein HYY16_06180 [Planctomycetes bacterium]|nr:hypothetical protein [Planctomycetota bacterium]